MRTTQLMMLCIASGVPWGGGCLGGRGGGAPTTALPADQFVGKNLDALVKQLGPPTRSSPADSDQTTIVWQFETATGTPPPTGSGGLYGDGGSPSYVSQGYSPFCRITATVATSSGIVTQANMEESNGTGASMLRRGESICAQHLRAKS
jgi:hypothetical protein